MGKSLFILASACSKYVYKKFNLENAEDKCPSDFRLIINVHFARSLLILIDLFNEFNVCVV